MPSFADLILPEDWDAAWGPPPPPLQPSQTVPAISSSFASVPATMCGKRRRQEGDADVCTDDNDQAHATESNRLGLQHDGRADAGAAVAVDLDTSMTSSAVTSTKVAGKTRRRRKRRVQQSGTARVIAFTRNGAVFVNTATATLQEAGRTVYAAAGSTHYRDAESLTSRMHITLLTPDGADDKVYLHPAHDDGDAVVRYMVMYASRAAPVDASDAVRMWEEYAGRQRDEMREKVDEPAPTPCPSPETTLSRDVDTLPDTPAPEATVSSGATPLSRRTAVLALVRDAVQLAIAADRPSIDVPDAAAQDAAHPSSPTSPPPPPPRSPGTRSVGHARAPKRTPAPIRALVATSPTEAPTLAPVPPPPPAAAAPDTTTGSAPPGRRAALLALLRNAMAETGPRSPALTAAVAAMHVLMCPKVTPVPRVHVNALLAFAYEACGGEDGFGAWDAAAMGMETPDVAQSRSHLFQLLRRKYDRWSPQQKAEVQLWKVAIQEAAVSDHADA